MSVESIISYNTRTVAWLHSRDFSMERDVCAIEAVARDGTINATAHSTEIPTMDAALEATEEEE